MYIEADGEKLNLVINRRGDFLDIQAVTADGEPYGSITRAYGYEGNSAIIDTNNWPELPAIIEQYKLGKDTGKTFQSGFCTYPIYEFDVAQCKKYTRGGK